MAIIVLSLQLPEDFFYFALVTPIPTQRMLHYPPRPADTQHNQNTDRVLVTILAQDDIGGLEACHAGVRLYNHLSETVGYQDTAQAKQHCTPVEFAARCDWLGSGIASIIYLEEAGAPISIGVDAVTVEDVVRWGTTGDAKVLGLDDPRYFGLYYPALVPVVACGRARI